jgi:hypothetical protein
LRPSSTLNQCRKTQVEGDLGEDHSSIDIQRTQVTPTYVRRNCEAGQANALSIPSISVSLADPNLPRFVQSREFSTTASAILILHRRTFYRTVRTKDAAVARLGAQQRPAVGAFVEKLACGGRHSLSLREAADRTHEDGLKNNFGHIILKAKLWAVQCWLCFPQRQVATSRSNWQIRVLLSSVSW